MNFTQIEKALDDAAKQTGLLGTLFWWDLGNNRIEHSVLRQHCDDAHLPEALVPPAVKPVNAFRRAWRAAARHAESDMLMRQIAETPEQVVVAAVREKPDVLNLDLRYEVMARVSFDKRSERVFILEKTPLTEQVEQLFGHYSAVTTEDIRAMILAFVRKSGLSIRHAGGVYFIPPALTETLHALTDVLRRAGNNTVWALPIADLGDAAGTLAALAHETLDSEITAVEQELAAFDARDVDVRNSTLERRLQKFEELRGRTNLMAGALSFRADALLEKLLLLEGDVKKRLLGDALDAPLLTTAPDRVSAAETTSAPYDADVGF